MKGDPERQLLNLLAVIVAVAVLGIPVTITVLDWICLWLRS